MRAKPATAGSEPAQPGRADWARAHALQFYLREIGQVKLLTPAEEIGKPFSVTRERIRQIQDQTLRKLRLKMEERDSPDADETAALATAV